MAASTLPKYTVGAEAAQRDIQALFDLLADEAIDFTIAWQFPDPIGAGYPNRRIRVTIAQSRLSWLRLNLLTQWAAQAPSRDFNFTDGALLLTYAWIIEEDMEAGF